MTDLCASFSSSHAAASSLCIVTFADVTAMRRYAGFLSTLGAVFILNVP